MYNYKKVGFKNYAQYFYAQKPAKPVYLEGDKDFLLKGDITKAAYFTVKITNTGFDSTCNNCTVIKQEGGFNLYTRDAAVNKPFCNFVY